MTTFPTTGPITASVDVEMGDIWVVAGDADVTVVEVTPTDPTNEKDRRAADGDHGDLLRRSAAGASGRRTARALTKKYGSVQVSVRLASGSDLDAVSALGSIGSRASSAAAGPRRRRATSGCTT